MAKFPTMRFGSLSLRDGVKGTISMCVRVKVSVAWEFGLILGLGSGFR